jgi:membrane protease YdiL (CAAX protease family)
MAKLLIKWFQMATLVSSLILASSSWAGYDNGESADNTERPGYAVIVADVVFVRPLTFIAMLGGSVIFAVTLPISLITGTVGEAGMSLVADPAINTFARCLGCEEVGWRKFPQKDTAFE